MIRVGDIVTWIGFEYQVEKVKANGEFYATSLDGKSGKWLTKDDIE